VTAAVAAILIAPVKGLRVIARDEIELGTHGVREDRRFFLIDADARMVNGKRNGPLQSIVPDYSDAARTLSLRFPDGAVVAAPLHTGRRLGARFYAGTIAALEVDGPWSEAISEHVGAALRLVESVGEGGAVDRRAEGPASLVGTASVQRLAAAAGLERPLDARRLRMLLEFAGTAAHEEDGWLGREVRVGGAIVTVQGHVGRCLVTKRDPDSGIPDLDTLGALASYRREANTTEPLACGVFATVREPGTVRLGDAVELIQ